jgi:hypothetical protein
MGLWLQGRESLVLEGEGLEEAVEPGVEELVGVAGGEDAQAG